MADTLKRLCRSIQRVSGWSYQRVHNHLTQPGHHTSTCDWCKQQLALVDAGNQELARALGEEPEGQVSQSERRDNADEAQAALRAPFSAECADCGHNRLAHPGSGHCRIRDPWPTKECECRLFVAEASKDKP